MGCIISSEQDDYEPVSIQQPSQQWNYFSLSSTTRQTPRASVNTLGEKKIPRCEPSPIVRKKSLPPIPEDKRPTSRNLRRDSGWTASSTASSYSLRSSTATSMTSISESIYEDLENFESKSTLFLFQD
jgi:hypothetical protein